eukprot:COSAG01_NODE_57348_length_312_cov_35.089202_1_plen_52_part_01
MSRGPSYVLIYQSSLLHVTLKECAPDDLCDICEGSTWHVGEQGGYALEPRLR